jgi:hypothetical protein
LNPGPELERLISLAGLDDRSLKRKQSWGFKTFFFGLLLCHYLENLLKLIFSGSTMKGLPRDIYISILYFEKPRDTYFIQVSQELKPETLEQIKENVYDSIRRTKMVGTASVCMGGDEENKTIQRFLKGILTGIEKVIENPGKHESIWLPSNKVAEESGKASQEA